MAGSLDVNSLAKYWTYECISNCNKEMGWHACSGQCENGTNIINYACEK